MCQSGRLTLALPRDAETRRAGAALAQALRLAAPPAAFVTVAGELGAGKTTLVRGVLAALGVAEIVRSPTYTLIESYPIDLRQVHHLDWYRLTGPEELEDIGFRELLAPGHWIFVEWPERAAAVAATADLALELGYAEGGRSLEARAQTALGSTVLGTWIRGNA